jgi:hypothetical protein
MVHDILVILHYAFKFSAVMNSSTDFPSALASNLCQLLCPNCGNICIDTGHPKVALKGYKTGHLQRVSDSSSACQVQTTLLLLNSSCLMIRAPQPSWEIHDGVALFFLIRSRISSPDGGQGLYGEYTTYEPGNSAKHN